MMLRIPKVNNFFKCGLLILMLKVFIQSSSIIQISDFVDDIMSILGVLLLIVSAVSKGYRTVTYFIFAVLIVLGAYTSYLTGNVAMMMSIAVCMAAYGNDEREVIRFMYTYEVLILLCHTILAGITSLFGRENYMYISGQLCYTFGFGHPNVFSFIVINILLMWTWMNFEKITRKHFLVQLMIVCVNTVLTGTRTGLVIWFVLVLLFIYVKKGTGSLSGLVKFLVPIISGIQLLLDNLYLKQVAVVRSIDFLLSGRIKLGAYWLERKGISLFGQNMADNLVEWDEKWRLAGSIPLDNLYNHVMIYYGLAWLAVLCFFLYRAGNERSRKDKIFIILWILYGVVEIHGLNPVMMFSLILITGRAKTMRKVVNG